MKIIKYDQFFEGAIRNALIKPSDEEIAEGEKFLENGDPSWDISTMGCFYMDVSGKYSVYYTLWKYTPRFKNDTGWNMPTYHYIANLSTDFKTACEKAKKAAGRFPVMIDRYGTKMGLWKNVDSDVMIKGKYRGYPLGEIFLENPRYITWLHSELNNPYGEGKYTDNNKDRIEKIKYYNDLYWETVSNKNRETSKSGYVGKLEEKITHKAKVYKVKEMPPNQYDNKPQWKCYLIDDDENKFIVFLKQEVVIDDEISFTAKVKKHEEKLGIKFTVLYYFKILKIRNLTKLAQKYNII